MAVKNTVSLFIDGINYTANLVLPLKFGNFLDERLDECNLSLRSMGVENISPLTPVEIQVDNMFYLGKSVQEVQAETKYFIVATDSATEMQIGTGIYNHELYVVEVTKIAECFVVDTLTFTNNLGRTYTENVGYADAVWE